MLLNKAKVLDQFYTKPKVAFNCVEIMVKMGFISEHTNVYEPSCGEGVFLKALENFVDDEYIFGADLEPKIKGTATRDFLKDDLPHFNRAEVVVIGNPPYGKKGKLAVEFINRAFDMTDIVGFIVPLTLSTSWTAQKQVRPDAELIYEIKLPKNSFIHNSKEVNVPSVFQIWRKAFKDLRLSKPQTEHPDIEIRIYNKTEGARKWLEWDWDLAVKRNSKKGTVSLNKNEVIKGDTHWILIKGNMKNLLKIDWSKVNNNKMTAGMGKADVVRAYMEVCNEIK